jgi:nitrile hydratase
VHGIHDLGGMEGFGPVVQEKDEPLFHQPWERRAFAITMATFPLLRGGQFRHGIERMDPRHYLDSSYYEHWLTSAATGLVENGHITREELEACAPGFPLAQPMTTRQPETGPDNHEPRHQPGDPVRVRQRHTPGHTRCPRYVEGKRGTVVRVDVVAPIPDVEAHTGQRRRVPTYSVRFDAAELWGDDPDNRNAAVHVDVWETYLEPA